MKDGPSPSLVLQLYFTELPELEAALSPAGHLAALTSRAEFPTLAHAEVAHQAMWCVRSRCPNRRSRRRLASRTAPISCPTKARPRI